METVALFLMELFLIPFLFSHPKMPFKCLKCSGSLLLPLKLRQSHSSWLYCYLFAVHFTYLFIWVCFITRHLFKRALLQWGYGCGGTMGSFRGRVCMHSVHKHEFVCACVCALPWPWPCISKWGKILMYSSLLWMILDWNIRVSDQHKTKSCQLSL